MVGEQRDVLPPRGQRRDADLHHVEAVVEVLAKTVFGNLARQFAPGCRDDAHVDGQRPRASEALNLTFLEHPRSFTMGAERELANLVQKQRAAVGPLEASLPPGQGTGERALLHAEEL